MAPRGFVEVHEYARICAKLFQTSYRRMVAGDREPRCVEARFAMYKALTHRGYGITQVGEWFNFHHTTVLHGVKRANERMAIDADYREKVLQLSELQIAGKRKRSNPETRSEKLYANT